MDWELTKDEFQRVCREYRPDIVNFSEAEAVAQTQAKKLVKHYEGQCTEHWRHTSWYVPRRRCDSCMMELYRKVGLE